MRFKSGFMFFLHRFTFLVCLEKLLNHFNSLMFLPQVYLAKCKINNFFVPFHKHIRQRHFRDKREVRFYTLCSQTLVFWAWQPFFRHNCNCKYDLWVPVWAIMTCDMNRESRECSVTLLVKQNMTRPISQTSHSGFFNFFIQAQPKTNRTKQTVPFICERRCLILHAVF